MENQTNEINEIIKKNLPAQVGEVLKERLEKADQDEKQLKIELKKVNDRDKTISELNKTLSEYKKFDDRNHQLKQREKEIENNERNLKIQGLEYQLQSEKDKTQFSKEVALDLVRNTEFKRNVFDNTRDLHGKTDEFGNITYENKDRNIIETKTKE